MKGGLVMQVQKTLFDVFIDGARKGWVLGVNSILPNVLMAFVLIQMLKVSGILGLIGSVFGPLMAIFGLPGESVTVIISTFPSMGGGVGVAASLYQAGILSATQLTILVPAIMLVGAQLQFMGRLLGVAEVPTRYYPALFGITFFNALLSLFVMKLLV